MSHDHVNRTTGAVERTPVGVDPGWATNPGAARVDNVQAHLTGKLDALTPEARRIAIGDVVGSPMFRAIQGGRFPYVKETVQPYDPANVARGRIATPVASIPDVIAHALEAETRTVLFSVMDATKQKGKPEADRRTLLSAEDYAHVQTVIDVGEIILQERQVAIIGTSPGFGEWFVLLRRALTNPREIFLKSFHRSDDRVRAKQRKRGVIIRDEG